MKNQILSGNFIFCPRLEQPVLSTECSGCMYAQTSDDAVYCVYEEDDEE